MNTWCHSLFSSSTPFSFLCWCFPSNAIYANFTHWIILILLKTKKSRRKMFAPNTLLNFLLVNSPLSSSGTMNFEGRQATESPLCSCNYCSVVTRVRVMIIVCCYLRDDGQRYVTVEWLFFDRELSSARTNSLNAPSPSPVEVVQNTIIITERERLKEEEPL